MTEEVQILKTDVLGRVTMPKEKREAILDEFEQSAMSGQKFAEYIGVKYATFATWIQKRKKARGEYSKLKDKKKMPLALIEAVMSRDVAKQSLCVELSNGAKIKVYDKSQLELAVELIRALG